MQFVFRVDASIQIGTGHVMRCLTLAQNLRAQGACCHFVCRAHAGNSLELIRQLGFDASELPVGSDVASFGYSTWLGGDWASDARQTVEALSEMSIDWLIVDHYAIDVRWESALRGRCRRLMVIDDLANRVHDCDLLLDQNVYEDAKDRYSSLTPSYCICLVGPQFALLRPEFMEARSLSTHRRLDSPVRLHVFFGGTDPTSQTLRVLTCIPPDLQARLSIDVVIGEKNPDRVQILTRAAKLADASVSIQVSDIARHIAEADFAIGACGSAALERCSLGLPALTLITADNQRQLAAGLVAHDAIILLGDAESVSDVMIERAIQSCLLSPKRLAEVGAAGVRLFGAYDGVQRVVKHLLN